MGAGELGALPWKRLLKRGVLRRPRWGNLRRLEPFSATWGFDRGTPVDRRYIETFLAGHCAKVRGTVLEVGERLYTSRFGQAVDRSHVVDQEGGNPSADVRADLGVVGSLPTGVYDCFIMTQTLQFIPSPDVAVRNAYDCLRPGGWLLITAPALEPVNMRDPDLWRFPPAALHMLVSRALPDGRAEFSAFGNLVSAIAALQGLAAEELREDELAAFDARYPVVSCAAVEKPAVLE